MDEVPQRPDDPTVYRAIQEKNYQTSLKVWWSRDFGFLALLDPFTGEVIEIERTKETPKWLTYRAMEEKTRRRSSTPRPVPPSGTSSGSGWPGSSAW